MSHDSGQQVGGTCAGCSQPLIFSTQGLIVYFVSAQSRKFLWQDMNCLQIHQNVFMLGGVKSLLYLILGI